MVGGVVVAGGDNHHQVEGWQHPQPLSAVAVGALESIEAIAIPTWAGRHCRGEVAVVPVIAEPTGLVAGDVGFIVAGIKDVRMTQVGDTVTTSGLGAIFPRDVFVGKVVRLRRTDASLYQEVEVEPSVDFGKLREVLIVLSPPPAPDPDLGKRPTDSARGVGIPR